MWMGLCFRIDIQRYRYSLAHEVGHIYLHKNILGPFQFDSVVDWAEFIDRMDGSVHSKLEYQGYSFGGLVLVPPRPLAEKVKLHISDIEPLVRKAQESGIRKSAYIGNAIDSLSSILAPMFDVSQEVIIKRIELDKLERLIP